MSFSEPIEQVWDLSTLTRTSSIPASDENRRLLLLSYIQSKTDKSVSGRLSNEIQQMIQSQHVGEIYSIVFSADGKTIITSGKDAQIRIWRND